MEQQCKQKIVIVILYYELYNSKVYADLEKEETKLWHEGATYIYESFKEEKQNQKLV